MPSQTNEAALERAIEKHLTGTCLEELTAQSAENTAAEPAQVYRSGQGYYLGLARDYDAAFAIDKRRLWDFLETTQAEELEKLKRHSDWQRKILERLDRTIKKYGILRVLRKGLDVDDAHLTMFYQLPLASSGEAVRKRFETNQFSVMRQVPYSLDRPNQTIDMVLFLNGIALATMELKNAWTGQNARNHAQHQYKFDRDITQPLLQFGRCVVHFAVDTDEVYMTTRLNGKKTFFLPFNQGYNNGKGNPPNLMGFGHRTDYLWNQVLTRESLANILQHFVRFDGKATDALSKRTLFFPRYHQLDVVRKLVADLRENGVGKTYLIQHSAGSGKSYSITWTAYQLIETYPGRADLPGAKRIDAPLFNSVIVVTDRRLLDKQLRESIREFSEVKNILAPAYSSKDLKENLEQGKKIIITTIQKFPFIVEGIADLRDKTFAVIIDEAHSSQSGRTADKMNQSMGGGGTTATSAENGGETDASEPTDPQDKIAAVLRKRKMRDNASYFAFTATPKPATLERFGQPTETGGFEAFHLYSMKQAIEEGFILDVLSNYTTYQSYYELQKSVQDDPTFDTAKAQKKLKAYVERHPSTIATKAEIMLEHFLAHVYRPKKLNGKGKAMVVTQSIESAIRYFQALKNLLEVRGNPFRIMVAFSGDKPLDGLKWNEENINDLPPKMDRARSNDPGYIADKMARYFDMDEYRILVVANKYLTGFDQPKLCAMYVDKRLQGVQAVQTLSRLNRAAPKYNKRTEDLFVLDFFNSVEAIKEAFDPFYTSTKLTEPTDVNVLHELLATLGEVGVYEWAEVESFVAQYFDNVDAQALSPIIDVAAARFNEDLALEKEEKADFKIKAKQFVKIYGQMAAILPYDMPKWEKLFWFLKFLIPKLIIVDPDAAHLNDLLESVDLSTYGLERKRLSAQIELDASEAEVDPLNPNPRGAHGAEKGEDTLAEIIRQFNERWFQGWEATPEEQRVKLMVIQQGVQAHPDFPRKVADNPDVQNRDLALKKILDEVMAKQRRQELSLYKLHAQDEAFARALFETMKRALGM